MAMDEYKTIVLTVFDDGTPILTHAGTGRPLTAPALNFEGQQVTAVAGSVDGVIVVAQAGRVTGDNVAALVSDAFAAPIGNPD